MLVVPLFEYSLEATLRGNGKQRECKCCGIFFYKIGNWFKSKLVKQYIISTAKLKPGWAGKIFFITIKS